jgi:two-component system chemotaxis response regulator CheY
MRRWTVRLRLELIRSQPPDVVILDGAMPGLDGPGFVRIVRSPATFPHPDVPIIMLTGYGERSRVTEAVKIGVDGFLLKPVLSNALQDCVVAVLSNPRQTMQSGEGWAPSKLATAVHADNDQVIANLPPMN